MAKTEDTEVNVLVKLSGDAVHVLDLYQTAHGYIKRDEALNALLLEADVRKLVSAAAKV